MQPTANLILCTIKPCNILIPKQFNIIGIFSIFVNISCYHWQFQKSDQEFDGILKIHPREKYQDPGLGSRP